MSWSKEEEGKLIDLRSKGFTYKQISQEMIRSISSVKHKVRRIQQSLNLDKYKHTKEKKDQFLRIERHIPCLSHALETHCGFGGMTSLYSDRFDHVECYDIKKERIDHVSNLGFEGCTPVHGDSEKEIIRILCNKRTYNFIDIDPYGMPSRYFPYVMGLIEDGVIVFTLPMIGVAQMNKITIRHLEAFWGVDYREKDLYIESVIKRLKDFAFMHKRAVSVIDIERIERIYRVAIKVKKQSLCDIVGLKVNR